jgi:hypothetical protein
MVPVITLNGLLCFLFALVLVASPTARAHPVALTALATVAWIGAYAVLEAGNIAFKRTASMLAYVAACATAAGAVTYWLWPACASVVGPAVVRSGGVEGVLESWVTIALFALSLLIVLGIAHFFQHAHAAIGRLAALPIVPLFGLYTVATVTAGDPAALAKLDALRSLLLVGWGFALAFAVVFAIYVTRSAAAPSDAVKRVTGMVIGWSLCLAGIVAAAKFAAAACGG